MLLINFQTLKQPIWAKSFFIKACVILREAKLNDNKVSLIFCSSAYMRSLNFKYCKKDKSTDVLSWGYEKINDNQKAHKNLVIGDVAICMPKVIKQAAIYQWDEESEALRLFTHGLAHILGYEHETNFLDAQKMLKFESKILQTVGIDLPKNQHVTKQYQA